jgi:hypothetical protein
MHADGRLADPAVRKGVGWKMRAEASARRVIGMSSEELAQNGRPAPRLSAGYVDAAATATAGAAKVCHSIDGGKLPSAPSGAGLTAPTRRVMPFVALGC